MVSKSDFFRELAGRLVENRLLSEGCLPMALYGLDRSISVSVRFARYNVAVAFVIREFKPEDFDMLWRVDQECFPAGIAYSKQELKTYVQHRGAFSLVAAEVGPVKEAGQYTGKDSGQAAGFIVVHGGPAGHVITIDVIPAARRLGVGSLLLQAAEDRLRAAGSRAVGLETAVDNLTALTFYKRHGYSVVRTWPRYYPNGVDALVMKKELT
jgi:[ribosomal protein S18]-alanine N-acetyltransferase